jgi:transposase
LFELLGPSADCLVALEATGHYWRNLFVALIAKDYAVAVLNPLRTARFAEEELRRTKTDAIDALGIARFAQQKRQRAAQLPDSGRKSCVSWSGCASGLRRTSPTV